MLLISRLAVSCSMRISARYLHLIEAPPRQPQLAAVAAAASTGGAAGAASLVQSPGEPRYEPRRAGARDKTARALNKGSCSGRSTVRCRSGNRGGIVGVWSTIRLEMMRGSASNTLPLVC